MEKENTWTVSHRHKDPEEIKTGPLLSGVNNKSHFLLDIILPGAGNRNIFTLRNKVTG